jgi:hypothetical protein
MESKSSKIARLRKKPTMMNELTDLEMLTLILDDGSHVVEAKGKGQHFIFKSEPRRHRGGRPREDELRAKVQRLQAEGKTNPQIKAIVEKENKEHRSPDAYRKLAGRKPPKL